MKPYSLETSTSTLIKKSSYLLIRLANQSLKAQDIPHTYTPFLMQLWQKEGLTQAVLHRKVGVEQSTAVRTLNRMERAGLIHRDRSESDKRKVQIFLTDKAKRLKEGVWECAKQLNVLAMEGFSGDDVAVLNRMLKAVISNLERNLK